MDPVTLVTLIALFVLGGGGVGASALLARRKEQRRLMRDAIRRRAVCRQEGGARIEVSLFDVFWDLGVSDFALEILGRQGLLMREVQELPVVLDAIADAVEMHGSYAAFVRENLETIQEFYEEHRRAGHRRLLPAMRSASRKTVALLPPGESSQALTRSTTPGRSMDLALDERIAARRGQPLPTSLHAGGRGLEVDIDRLTTVDPIAVLKGIFSGDAGRQLERWWELRTLRALRQDLDAELAGFYDFYVDQVDRDPRFYHQLYDTAERWSFEARRIDDLAAGRPWRGHPWATCADALVAEAAAVARQLAYQARQNVDRTLERIHEEARGGDMAMAGYLVYLNHYALFAGRAPGYDAFVRRIDACTYKLQSELRELKSRGAI